MAERIFWTEDEWNQIADNIASYLINNPGSSLPAAYKKTCGCLPKNRRRAMNTNSVFDSIIPKIKDIIKKKREDNTVEPLQPELVERVVCVPSNIKDFTTDQLQAELYRRQLEPVINNMANVVANQVISRLTNGKNGANKPEFKNKLPRILVVGLLTKQAAEIKKEFSGIFDLKFHESGDIDKRLKEVAPNCDEIILMTKFIGHNHQNIVRNCDVKMTLCDGGMTQLRKLLECLFDVHT